MKILYTSSNYALYGDMSTRVMAILQQFTPEVEVYSIDEAFLNLAGCGDADLQAYGQRIRHAVHQWTGIPISIGIGSTKTLAKLANRLAKRSEDAQGVVDLTSTPHHDDVLQSVPVQDIWGIGRSYARLLHANGIGTALDLRNADDRWTRRAMGVVGVRIVWELRGIACVPLALHPPPKKSLMVSRSFGRPITSLEEMREAVATYTTRAAEKLRRYRLAAGILTVFLMTNPFKEEDPAPERPAAPHGQALHGSQAGATGKAGGGGGQKSVLHFLSALRLGLAGTGGARAARGRKRAFRVPIRMQAEHIARGV